MLDRLLTLPRRDSDTWVCLGCAPGNGVDTTLLAFAEGPECRGMSLANNDLATTLHHFARALERRDFGTLALPGTIVAQDAETAAWLRRWLHGTRIDIVCDPRAPVAYVARLTRDKALMRLLAAALAPRGDASLQDRLAAALWDFHIDHPNKVMGGGHVMFVWGLGPARVAALNWSSTKPGFQMRTSWHAETLELRWIPSNVLGVNGVWPAFSLPSPRPLPDAGQIDAVCGVIGAALRVYDRGLPEGRVTVDVSPWMGRPLHVDVATPRVSIPYQTGAGNSSRPSGSSRETYSRWT